MAKQLRSLTGTVVAITGGARGIGRATASACAAAGCKVALGDLDGELAAQTAGEIGGGTIAIEVDVIERGSFTRFLDEVEARHGPLDVLVNNAGIMHIGEFGDEDDAAARRMIEVNLVAVILGSKLALQRFRARGRGHLVNIASAAGRLPIAGAASYTATKHAVVGLSDAIRQELHGTGIEVSVVMPTVVNTELVQGVEHKRALKWVEPEDVAAAIVGALRAPKFDVWVPGSLARLFRTIVLLPRRASEGLGRAMGASRLMLDANHAARVQYEARAARATAAAPPESLAEFPPQAASQSTIKRPISAP